MKTRYLLGLLLMGALTLGVRATEASAPTDTPEPTNTPEMINSRLDGELIPMGSQWDDDYPAIAYSTDSDQYFYVYQQHSGSSYGIRGRFIDSSTGNHLGSSFVIASSSTRELNNPDVAYNPYLNVFLVVWDQYYCTSSTSSPKVPYCNYEIRGRYIYGEHSDTSQFASNIFTIASQHGSPNFNDLRDPAVAYNANDKNFLVVFLRDEDGAGAGNYTDVFGQMINGSTVYNPPGQLYFTLDGFSIRSYSTYNVYTPDVAWSSDEDTYVATWETDPPSDTDYIAAAYIHDEYQGGSGQTLKIWNISSPLAGSCAAPAIAYDSLRDAYVVVFEYDEPAILESRLLPVASTTIRGQRMRPDYNESGFRKDGEGAFIIENETGYADVTYYGYPDIAEAGRAGEMHVIYRTWTTIYLMRITTMCTTAR